MPSNNSISRQIARRRAKRSADKRIASLVTKEVVKLIPQIVAQVHSLSRSRASKDSKTESPQSTFLYKHFKARDPMEFTGEGGVTQLLQWFDSIEVTLRQSGCPDSFHTTCATGVFQSRALDWWTAERNKRGISAAYTLSWDELKELMKEEYCLPHEVQKLENEFWEIKQTEGDNAGYTARFKQLSTICPSQVNTSEKPIPKYIRCLPECVGDFVEAARPATIEEAYRLAADINSKRVLDGFFSKKPVKPAHQAIIINSSDGSSGESVDDSSDNSSEGSSKDCSDNVSVKSSGESDDDTASSQEAQPGRKRKTESPDSTRTGLSQPEPLRAVPVQLKRAYNGPYPLCFRCTYHLPPEANCRYCTNWHWYGHHTQNYRAGPQP
ncbi:putative retrotransposon gag domain-containing protein [Helianthus annuus]|nr:putative retrotransposon gag domain-containing protein [Helianthus annuus]